MCGNPLQEPGVERHRNSFAQAKLDLAANQRLLDPPALLGDVFLVVTHQLAGFVHVSLQRDDFFGMNSDIGYLPLIARALKARLNESIGLCVESIGIVVYMGPIKVQSHRSHK